MDSDEVLNGIVEVVVVGLGGKHLDTACIQKDTSLRTHI
jgi:hypothetical protein